MKHRDSRVDYWNAGRDVDRAWTPGQRPTHAPRRRHRRAEDHRLYRFRLAEHDRQHRRLRSLAAESSSRAIGVLGYPTPIVSATGQTIDAELSSLPNLRTRGLEDAQLAGGLRRSAHVSSMWNLVDRPAIQIGVDILSRFEFGLSRFRPQRSSLPPAGRRRRDDGHDNV